MQEIKLGEKLKSFFKEKGLTQEMIAQRMGVSQAYISALLNDRQQFGKKQADKWSKEFGLSSNWLLTGVGPMQNPVNNQFAQMTEKEIEDTAADTFAEMLMKLYQQGEIYPASIHNKIVAEKNEEIAKRDKRIEELQREVWEFKQRFTAK
ncbi:helix-turn-helix transcriptional regulator [uncultured Alistipes sp.]|uniref:helix-turn-helix domain-containing protein n=1 Tax=uncultured Alistipes sp. TaxID=538949 RepID=UPI00261B3631|nr:helix-turn-helix transcriptional regulator [uncultured Alistipes sp.]